MNKQINTIERLVYQYKPAIESIFGMEIGDVRVEKAKPSSSLAERLFYDLIFKLKGTTPPEDNTLMHVERGKNTIFVHHKKLNETKKRCPGLVEYEKRRFGKLKKVKIGDYEIEEVTTAHELAHLLCYKHNLLEKVQHPGIEYLLSEGFAEYVALEYPEIYQDITLPGYEGSAAFIKDIMQEEEKKIKECDTQTQVEFYTYLKGREFFKKVAEKIGKENILKVFEKPPESMEEILEQEKYLERIGEQIRNVPEWSVKG